ncbi:MAG TPA: glycosyl hydrolase family 18 protein, partial [Mucilaginibacter sp.]
MRKYVLLITLLAGFLMGYAQKSRPARFRVIGYLRLDNILSGEANQIDYGKVTHINIAFINPDSTGNFANIPGLKEFVDMLHQKHIKILASIGGGLAPTYYSNLLVNANREAFIQKLAQLTTLYDLDGIDIDLEGERIDADYENFILELSNVLKTKGKLLTAAVATVYKTRYTGKALARFDFINIMSYDKTGPWRPEKPGPHAPYAMAVDDINYWTTGNGIAKEKLNLGIPFYGYGFGPNAPTEMAYRGIISKYSGAEKTDSVSFKGGGTLYYNGISTIKNKTTLALQQAGGIMIWQLLQDASGTNSLLN